MRIPSIHDPFRPTNWRWERARWLREHGKYLRKGSDDEYTVLAKKFQAEQGRARNDAELANLERKYPGLFNAIEIYQRAEQDTRWTIEATLLAGEPMNRIAERTRTSDEVVFWYEKLFFNVLPCLGARYYIVNVVIGSAVHHGLNDREYDLLWKLFGYFGKGHVLDFLITTFSGATPADRPEAVPAYMTDDGRMTVKRKSALAARLLPMHNNYTMQVILETHAKMMEIEKAGGGEGSTDTMMDCVGAMMLTLCGPDGSGGVLYAGNKPDYVDTPRLSYYDSQATELRAHEHLAVTLGQEEPGLKDEVSWTFPDPPAAPSAGPVS